MSDVKIGIIGGTGLGQLLARGDGKRHTVQTPFGATSDAIIESDWEGLPVLLLGRHAPGHVIPPGMVPFRANIFALKQLGCTHIIASGACGSLRQEFKPRDLVAADQMIDRTFRRAGTFLKMRPCMWNSRNLSAPSCVESFWNKREPAKRSRCTIAAAMSAWKARRFLPARRA